MSYGLGKYRKARMKKASIQAESEWESRNKKAKLIEMQEISRLQLPPYHALQCLTVHSHHSPAFSSPSLFNRKVLIFLLTHTVYTQIPIP